MSEFDFSSLIKKEALKPQEILSVENIKKEKKAQISSFVDIKNISHTLTTDITEDNTIGVCPPCNRRYKITQDKSMNKDTIIDWFMRYLTKNKQNFTLDWLRGQKLTFESVNEIRK